MWHRNSILGIGSGNGVYAVFWMDGWMELSRAVCGAAKRKIEVWAVGCSGLERDFSLLCSYCTGTPTALVPVLLEL
jgi:hypothetical protein